MNIIPLYQIHWHDNITPISETMEALQRCKEAGKIRYIGCSNFDTELILKAFETQRVESLQCQYNLIQRELEIDMVRCFEILEMGIIVYGTLGRGLFSGKYNLDSKFETEDTRSGDDNFHGEKFRKNLQLLDCLKEIGACYNKSSSQVAIQWALSNPAVTCAIIGIKTPEQVVENSGAIGWKLKKEDIDTLTTMEKPCLIFHS